MSTNKRFAFSGEYELLQGCRPINGLKKCNHNQQKLARERNQLQ